MSEAPTIERKRRLDGTFVDFHCERLLVEPGKRAVLRYVIDRHIEFEGTGVVLDPGSITIAHYWVDRPYNVYHWSTGGRTVGYYCNVADETRIAGDHVEYLDLVVDVLIDPSGRALVLDEEELPEDLAPGHRRTIARALERLLSAPRRITAEVDAEGARWS